MASLAQPLAVGTLFGAALTASGVYSPSVIITQLQMRNMHMLLSFLTASACSAAVIALANHFHFAKLEARKESTYGWSRYDGNVVGGALIGLGMSLTGACPGTVLVQTALSYPSARVTLAGCILGGFAFIAISSSLTRTSTPPAPQPQPLTHSTSTSTTKPPTPTSLLLAYELTLLLIILSAQTLQPPSHWLHPVAGGILIGLAQTASILLSKKTLGVSGAYSELASNTVSFVRSGGRMPGARQWGQMSFAVGVMGGARVLKGYVPAEAGEVDMAVGVVRSVVGGFVMIFGARMAGGCTSGHGISGMSTLGLSSFVTVGAMFGGGMLAALVL